MVKVIKRVSAAGSTVNTDYVTEYTNGTDGPAMIIQVHISNDHVANAVNAWVRITDSAGSLVKCSIANRVSVPASSAVIDTTKYIIESGEKLQFKPENTNGNLMFNVVIVEGIND